MRPAARGVSARPSGGAGAGTVLAGSAGAAPPGGVELSSENPLCPFTGKSGWQSKAGARQALAAQRRQGLEVWRFYLCQCGLYHLTSKRGARR